MNDLIAGMEMSGLSVPKEMRDRLYWVKKQIQRSAANIFATTQCNEAFGREAFSASVLSDMLSYIHIEIEYLWSIVSDDGDEAITDGLGGAACDCFGQPLWKPYEAA